MEILDILWDEIIGFLGIGSAWEIFETVNYEVFQTYDGIVTLIYPLIPLLVILEFIQIKYVKLILG